MIQPCERGAGNIRKSVLLSERWLGVCASSNEVLPRQPVPER